MTVIYPRLGALVNGQRLSSVIEASAVSSASSDVSSFHLTCILSQEPPFDALFWSSEKNVEVEIYAGGADGETISLMQGGLDCVIMDRERKRVHISGRDLGSSFLERSSDDAFVNMTASEIATAIAARHGFASSIYRTTRIVGRPDADGKDYIALPLHSRRMSDWDILTDLARQENFDVYIISRVLYFRPATASTSSTVRISADNVVGLRLNRRPSVSQPCQVRVHTWNSWQRTSTTEEAQFAPDGGTTSSSRVFNIVEPGLDSETAISIARRQLESILAQEYRVDFSVLVPVRLYPRDNIALCGTDSLFDQIYRIEMVEAQYHPSTGFRQRIHAVGLAARSEPDNRF